MNKPAAIHQDHLHMQSELEFYQVEIRFLQKLICRQYESATHSEDIRTLDQYWKEFDQVKTSMEKVHKQILTNEHNFKQVYLQELSSIFEHSESEEGLIVNFYDLRERLKIMKESFYAYMLDLHKKHA